MKVKLRKALLLALPVAGLVACESNEEAKVEAVFANAQTSTTTLPVTTTEAEKTTTTKAEKTTTTKAPTTTKVTTTKAPTTTKIRQFDEVQIVPGTLQRSSRFFWKVQLSASNHSSKTSTYYVDFACYFQGVQHDTGFALIQAVPPNATIAVESLCHNEDIDEVRIVSVERDETVGR